MSETTGRPPAPTAAAPTAAAPTAAAGRAVAAPRLAATARAYLALTKPRVIELLLVTTVPAMILAADRMPSLGLVLATLVGGAGAAGSANAFNCVFDRDIDRVMNRTRRRPLVTGAVTARGALIFACVLGLGSLVWLAVLVNPFAAALTLVAIAIYVLGYTLWLKRRTPQNIVWGGLAGCMPVFIGWSAVTGSLSWAPVALFGVVFFWTPPHYWPLSIKFRTDYARAGVPMLPVVADAGRVAREMVAYCVAMIACSLALVPLADMTWAYAVVATVLGAWFLAATIGLLRRAVNPARGKLAAMHVFHASITYLTLLFVAVAVDVFVPW